MKYWKSSLFFTLLLFVLLVPLLLMSGTTSKRAQASSPILGESENMEFIGHVGGPSTEIVVQGNYAYMNFGPEFAVMDISNPQQPVKVGYIMFESKVYDITVDGAYAYVALGEAGLYILDISNPTRPKEVTLYEPNTSDVVIVENYAYLGTSTGLQILDISDPIVPNKVGHYETETAVILLTVRGDYAYLCEDYYKADCDIVITNISDKDNIVKLGSEKTYYYFNNMVIKNNFAYFMMYNFDWLYEKNSLYLASLDISDPANPVMMNQFSLGIDHSPTYMALAGAENYLYTASEGQLNVFDLSNPITPTLMTTYETEKSPADIAIADGYAYVADSLGGLRIYDISNPMMPSEVGAYLTISDAREVIEEDGYIYVADGGESKGLTHLTKGGLKVIDYSSIREPVIVGEYNISLDYNDSAGGLGLTIKDDYLYLLRGRHTAYRFNACYSGLQIISILEPTTPELVKDYEIDLEYDFCSLPDKMDMVSNYVYLPIYNSYLSILDVSKPANPLEIALNEIWGFNDVTIVGDFAYLIGRELRILDISQPNEPIEISRYEVRGDAISISGDYAYIIDGPNELRIVDISKPSVANEVGFYEIAGYPQDITISGDLAFVASGSAGVRVIDVSDPTAPIEVGFYDTPVHARSVFVGEPYLYVADGTGGMFILQFGHTIAGRTLDVNHKPFAGVTISASSAQTLTTNSTGDYRLPHLLPDSYTLTPQSANYSFEPPIRTIMVPPDMAVQNFIVLASPVSTTLEPGITTTLTYTDTQGNATDLDVPANAVAVTTTLQLTPTIVANKIGFDFAGHAFDLATSALSTTFESPVSITLRYSEADVSLVTDENELALWWWTGNEWQEGSQTCAPGTVYEHDTENKQLKQTVCQTGRYALFGPTHQFFLPAVAR